ncbi:MAG: hypothetical protein VW268_10175 [Rhodospirillaceae bacterium]
MSATAAWIFIIVGFVLPLIHVMITPGLTPPPAAHGADSEAKGTCPFSPRTGWIVIILVLGPIGWLMFIASRRKRKT